MPRWLKRALYPLFWRYGPSRCEKCGEEVELNAPLRASRDRIWMEHGAWHGVQAMAAVIAEHQRQAKDPQ
jgi:hypothetical protein